MKLPRWDDPEALEKWTLAQLDKLDEPTQRDINSYIQTMTNDAYGEDRARFFGELLQRGKLVQAVEARDTTTINRLTANEPELQRLAIQLLTQKRERGRKKGDRRDTDHKPHTLEVLREAARDVTRIYDIWKRDFGKRNRSNHPTAVDIAAGRWGLDPEEIVRYRKTFAA